MWKHEIFVCDCGPDSVEGCVPGDDNADGLSPDTAIQTLPAFGPNDFVRGLNEGTAVVCVPGGHHRGLIWGPHFAVV